MKKSIYFLLRDECLYELQILSILLFITKIWIHISLWHTLNMANSSNLITSRKYASEKNRNSTNELIHICSFDINNLHTLRKNTEYWKSNASRSFQFRRDTSEWGSSRCLITIIIIYYVLSICCEDISNKK